MNTEKEISINGSASKRNIIIIFMSLLLGLLFLVSPATIFLLIIIICTAFFIYRFSQPEDRKFILSLFMVGISARIIIGMILHFILAYYGIGYENFGQNIICFSGDSGAYALRGWLIAKYWSGTLKNIHLIQPTWLFSGSREGFNFLMYAVFYYFFGLAALASKFINSLYSVISAVFIFFIAKDLFGRSVAKCSAILVAFFPSMFLWSVSYLKEPPTILLLCIILWAAVKMKDHLRFKYLFLALLAIFILYFLRSLLVIPVAASIIFSLLFKMITKKNSRVFLTFLGFLTIFLFFGTRILPWVESIIKYNIKSLIAFQQGYVSTPGDTYKIYPERFYTTKGSIPDIGIFEFLRALVKGWVYFLFSPFPWEIKSKLALTSYMQNILCYFLVPFTLLGIMFGIRYKFWDSFMVFFFPFVLTSILALSSGNIGAAFRHRDLVLSFFFIFTSLGIVKAFGGKIEF